ncbi:MAG: diguanylate cyclase [Campylobacterales bacterium]|nr:diguanylate cyclase [Campylobacterales bacterium]
MIRAELLIDAVHIGVMVVDAELKVYTWNRWMAIHTNIPQQNAISLPLRELFALDEERVKTLSRRIKTTLKLGSPTFSIASVEGFLLPIPLPLSNRANFDFMQQDMTIVPYDNSRVMVLIYDQTPLMESRRREASKSKELSSMMENATKTINKLKAAEALLVKQRDVIFRQANYDQLTNLPNRYLFQDRLNHAFKEAQRNKKPLALLFLDLDNFKRINDVLGHNIGDDVLIKAAEFLRAATRESDTLVRFGGDEFLVLLKDSDKDDALHVAHKILKLFKPVMDFKKHSLSLSPSIGIALFPDHANTPEALIQKADIALYVAKSRGKNQASVFSA